MKKFYIGKRVSEFGGEVYVQTHSGDKQYPLALRTDIRNHSPTGFNWGYGGSGPAQLALAILADHFGPEQPPEACPFCGSKMNGWKCSEVECGYDGNKDGGPWRKIHSKYLHYQIFKRDFIAKLPDEWTICGDDIDKWACQQQSKSQSQ